MDWWQRLPREVCEELEIVLAVEDVDAAEGSILCAWDVDDLTRVATVRQRLSSYFPMAMAWRLVEVTPNNRIAARDWMLGAIGSRYGSPNSTAFCSFCGMNQAAVRKLIRGGGHVDAIEGRRPQRDLVDVHICNECIELCAEIVAQPT